MSLEVVAKVERIGGRVFLERDRLKVRIPESYPEAKALVEELRARKREVIRLLQQRENRTLAQCGSPDCAGCYEIEPRRRIHPPKSGAPQIPPLPRRQVEILCWHCDSTGRCHCIVCAEGVALGASAECAICHGTGKAKQWVV